MFKKDKTMKIAVGMIVFEGDYVLKQCLEQLYPHVDQIVIAEGPVNYWQQQGRTTSLDRTNTILDSFPDPDHKLTVIHGRYAEKDEQSKAYISLLRDDIEYLWMVDSDEVYRTEDIVAMKAFLLREQPTSVGVRSCSFYGGFSHYLSGFELKPDNFLRVFKYMPGCTWKTHRPPTIEYPTTIQRKHVSSEELFAKTGIQMYHYSYVFPRQVYTKTNYYSTFVSGGTIPNYYHTVYLPWVKGSTISRFVLEKRHSGVHEWIPQRRGDCYTIPFNGAHPYAIQRDMPNLVDEFNRQLHG
jgi:hypothetical protein